MDVLSNKEKNGVRINIGQEQGYQGFTSHSGNVMFDAPDEWLTSYIEFHHKSEHTINDVQYDFEIQVFHKQQYPSIVEDQARRAEEVENEGVPAGAGGGAHRRLQETTKQGEAVSDIHFVPSEEKTLNEAAVAIMFSVNNHSPNITEHEQATLDKFFAQLRFETENPQVSRIDLGQLMDMLQWDNRWIYKGSHTYPPCEQYVYWNVISRVYPIDEVNLDLFKQKLNDIYPGLGETGNTRVIQRGFNKNVAFVSSGAAMLSGMLAAGFGAMINFL